MLIITCFVHTALDQVVTFGWNEHGVCGNGTQDNVLVPQHLDLTQCSVDMGPLGGRETEKWLAGHSFVLMSRIDSNM